MEHPALVLHKPVCGADNVCSGKAHIAVGKYGHERFDIIIPSACEQFLMHRAVKVYALSAYVESVPAKLIYRIYAFIACFQAAHGFDRIMAEIKYGFDNCMRKLLYLPADVNFTFSILFPTSRVSLSIISSSQAPLAVSPI